MTREPRVVAWMPTVPSVRVMARATAESAARGARLRVLSLVQPPPQWPAWQRAASSQGIESRWHVTATTAPDRLARELLHEMARAALVVTEPSALADRGTPLSTGSLVARTNFYVVTAPVTSRSPMHEPAVVVGVSDDRDDVRLVAAAAREAELRHRHLMVLHARQRGLKTADHRMEHRWLDVLRSPVEAMPGSVPARVVVAHRPVVDALRDHVEPADVLVLGLRGGCSAEEDPVVAPLLAAPPCDLLLTALPVRPPAALQRLGDEEPGPAPRDRGELTDGHVVGARSS